MSPEYPAPGRAEICQVLEWFDAHPHGKWADMGALYDVYKCWRKPFILGNPLLRYPSLVDDSSTMLTVPGLSPCGRVFLMEQQASQAGGSGPAGDRGDDPGSVRRPAPVCRLVVTDRCLTLDGQVVQLPDVTSERLTAVLVFIEELIAHPSGRRSGKEIEKAAEAREIIIGRVDRLKGLLPSSVQSLIKSNSRGYILAADAWRGLA
jgi:hypothetical protein